LNLTPLDYINIHMPPLSEPPVSIEPMSEQDWGAVRAIYLEGIATSNATFETTAPDWAKRDAGHLRACRLVARLQGDVLGWAALSPVSNRSVYTGVAEVSVYVAQRPRGQVVGSKLLASLVEASEREGIWTLQAGIFPENVPASCCTCGSAFALLVFGRGSDVWTAFGETSC